MSNIVKRCPQDGIEHDTGYAGNCETCSGPLQFYCRVHHQWLEDDVCEKCTKPSVASKARGGPSAESDVVVIAVAVGLLVVCVVGGYWGVSRLLHRSQKTSAPPVAQAQSPSSPTPTVVTTPVPQEPRAPVPPARQAAPPAPPTPKPVMPPAPREPQVTTPSFPTYPPIELSIAGILTDPQRYLTRLVRTSGVIQLVDTPKEMFDLRQAEHSLQVMYRHVGAGAKTAIANAPSGRSASVTGLLQLDETYNSYYLVARDVDLR